MSKNRPVISAKRLSKISREMISYRDMYFEDNPSEKRKGIVNAAKYWEWLAYENPDEVKIRFDKNLDNAEESNSFEKHMAFVVRLDPLTLLTASETKFEAAKNRSAYENLLFAHEFAHVALDHAPNSTAPLPYSLSPGEDGMNITAITDIFELEAQYGAIILIVGEQIFSNNLDVSLLAKNAAIEFYWLNKLYKICQLEVMQRFHREAKNMGRATF